MFLNLPFSPDAFVFWGGVAIAVIAFSAFGWDCYRKHRIEPVPALLQAVLCAIGVLVSVAGNTSSNEHAARDEVFQRQLDQTSQAVGNVSVGVQVRDLSQQQINELASAFRARPPGLRIDVQRCLSAESAITLVSDFAQAVNLAGLSISLGNVTTACPAGVVVGVHPGESQTMQFAKKAFDSVAGLKAQGVYSKDVAATTMVIYVGTKTPQTL